VRVRLTVGPAQIGPGCIDIGKGIDPDQPYPNGLLPAPLSAHAFSHDGAHIKRIEFYAGIFF
jgi:hypothetical protein